MSASELPLFTCGTLLDPAAQRRLFGRALPTEPAELLGHDLAQAPLADPAAPGAEGRSAQPGLIRRVRGGVPGALLRPDAAQLAAADASEAPARVRRRVLVRPAEGEPTPAWASVDANPLAGAQRIAVVGDSIAYGRITADGGWAAALGAWHIAREEQEHRLYQLAYPGTTVRRIREHILPELTTRKADTVVLSAGINDLLLDGTAPGALVELVAGLCADLEARGIRPLVLGPVWLDAGRTEEVLGHRPDPAVLAEYRERLASWAGSTRRDHRDPWPVLEGRAQRVRTDGLHPDAEGHRLLARWLLDLAAAPGEAWRDAD